MCLVAIFFQGAASHCVSHHYRTSWIEGIEILKVSALGRRFVSMCQLNILQQNARMLTCILKIATFSCHMQFGISTGTLTCPVLTTYSKSPR